jgi:hypothetical protein
LLEILSPLAEFDKRICSRDKVLTRRLTVLPHDTKKSPDSPSIFHKPFFQFSRSYFLFESWTLLWLSSPLEFHSSEHPQLNTSEKTGLNGCPAAMGSRKRTHSEAAPVVEQQAPEEPGLLSQLRSDWAFASLMQYIAIFGQVMKIDEDFGIEVCPLALCEMRSMMRFMSH